MAAIGLEIFFGPMTGAAFGRTEYVRPTGLKTDLELKRLFQPRCLEAIQCSAELWSPKTGHKSCAGTTQKRPSSGS